MSKPEIQQAAKRRLKHKKPVCTHKVYKGPGPYLHCIWCWKRVGQKKPESELKRLRAAAKKKKLRAAAKKLRAKLDAPKQIAFLMPATRWERIGQGPGHRLVGLKRYEARTSRHRNKRSFWFWFVLVQRDHRRAPTTLAWGYSKTERIAQDCAEAIIETVAPNAERTTPP
jgi:hypothetical protein